MFPGLIGIHECILQFTVGNQKYCSRTFLECANVLGRKMLII
jgi:hypothetical protein